MSAMRINVVSDVHGRADALAKAGEGADALICLGDLVLFIDYADMSQGIFPSLFGVERATEYVRLRTEKRFNEARVMSAALWAELGGDPRAHIEKQVRAQYADLFAAMPVPSYLTYGNVDVPSLWAEYTREGQTVLDGQTAEIGGLTFGFVGGGLQTRYRTSYELADEVYAAKVAALGPVDVLCTHIPPAVPDLLYDVVARRFERGSEATLDYIREFQPRYALFGHVHQPLVPRTRIGRTECLNVGHFRGRGTPFTLDL